MPHNSPFSRQEWEQWDGHYTPDIVGEASSHRKPRAIAWWLILLWLVVSWAVIAWAAFR